MLHAAKYLGLAILGSGIMLLILMGNGLLDIPEHRNHYYYPLKVSYTFISASLFFLIGVAVGYFSRLNPWITGFAVTLVFPVIFIIEVIKDANAVVPIKDYPLYMEFLMFLIFAFPAIMGVYIGRLIYNKRVVEGKR